jgi:hypothetical protein
MILFPSLRIRPKRRSGARTPERWRVVEGAMKFRKVLEMRQPSDALADVVAKSREVARKVRGLGPAKQKLRNQKSETHWPARHTSSSSSGRKSASQTVPPAWSTISRTKLQRDKPARPGTTPVPLGVRWRAGDSRQLLDVFMFNSNH